MVLDPAILKVDEINFSLITFLQKHADNPKKSYPRKNFSIDYNFMKDVICVNQGLIAQHAYLSAECHKKVKEELYKEGGYDKEKLKDLCIQLQDFTNKAAEFACETNAKYMHKYFEDRNWPVPRICVKLNDKDTNKVIDFYRDRGLGERTYSGLDTLLDTNTGFKYVYETGDPFLCNNIPEKAQKEEEDIEYYKNKRLNPFEVRGFKTNAVREWRLRRLRMEDKKWMSCWERTGSTDGRVYEPRPDECYKSTLIIPMTLLNNKLLDEFKTRFKIAPEGEHKGRSIYGYLCFDNQCNEYFKESDISAGYMFADLLSLYFITKLTYTTYSETFRRAKNEVALQ